MQRVRVQGSSLSNVEVTVEFHLTYLAMRYESHYRRRSVVGVYLIETNLIL